MMMMMLLLMTARMVVYAEEIHPRKMKKQTNKLPPNRTTTFAKIAKRNYKNILDIFASLRRMGLRSVDRQPKNVNTSCTFLSRDT